MNAWTPLILALVVVSHVFAAEVAQVDPVATPDSYSAIGPRYLNQQPQICRLQNVITVKRGRNFAIGKISLCLGVLVGNPNSKSSSAFLTAGHCSLREFKADIEEEVEKINQDNAASEPLKITSATAIITCYRGLEVLHAELSDHTEEIYPGYNKNALYEWMAITPLKRETFPLDLAVLRLKSPVAIPPLGIATRVQIFDPDSCSFTRQGSNGNGGPVLSRPRQIISEPSAPLWRIKGELLSGDSGGPLICLDGGVHTVVGINSFSPNARGADGYIQAITPPALEWILEKTR